MLTDSQAIVLKTVSFRESSLIATILSREHGKIALLARGARRNRSKFSGLMQPGSLLDVSYYYKSARQVQNLKEAGRWKATWQIPLHMQRLAIATATLELCEQICHENQAAPEIFDFLADFLDWLHHTSSNPKNLFPYIQFRLIELSGIGLQADDDNPKDCDANADEEDKAGSLDETRPGQIFQYLDIANGRLGAREPEGFYLKMTLAQSDYLQYILTGRSKTLLNRDFGAAEIKNLIHHLDVYIQYHIEGVRSRKSDRVFDQILFDSHTPES